MYLLSLEKLIRETLLDETASLGRALLNTGCAYHPLYYPYRRGYIKGNLEKHAE